MNILVINSGSSSIKYQLYKMPSQQPLCSGLVERIGLENSCITHKSIVNGHETRKHISVTMPDHRAAMMEVGKILTEPATGVIQHPEDIQVVGHRIVHGGETFTTPTIITAYVKAEIKRLFPLAPLHNPGHYQGIVVAEQLFKKAIHVAVFDTAFHQTMPAKAYRYAIPNSFYTDYGLRVYGFHGTSHKYVAEQAINYLNNPHAKIITIHLGNGCSMAAVDAGKCIDTSMGLTPLDGLIMGTRCGTIDASVVMYFASHLGYTTEQINNLLNKKSGMLGLTGFSDMRDIDRLITNGDEAATLAYQMYAYRIKKFIGAYTAVLNGLDALVFTAGVGENDAIIRDLICGDLGFLGVSIDKIKNCSHQTSFREINSTLSCVKILVVPTNEELEIALQCQQLLAEDCINYV